MTISDPAVAAAMRAWLSDDDAGEIAMLAAREALAPLRELHQRGTRCTCCGGRDTDGTPILRYECTGCTPGAPAYHHWPCATAKLIYSERELS